MKISFCGGAGEVGAACYLLKIDGCNILLDCGIRMQGGKDPLPDFRMIQESGGVDVILISHAHLDHTGSLPIISREYPEAPIFMTHASKDLVRVLLADSLKIMGQSDGEIPMYAEVHVEQMLQSICCHSPEHTFNPTIGNPLKVTFYQAGHILGACGIYIQGQEGSFFYSGDISAVSQHTVGKAVIPKLRPDAALMESTYGDKLHANREVEEERLVETVREVIARGGKILIPAFALGRAQEVILILKQAMRRGKLPVTDIFVDGMVREICRVYKLNPNYLRPSLAKKVWQEKEIFFSEHIRPVTTREMREEIVKQREPCCIISSSGMLTGGPSQWYAERLAGDAKNLIAITGYQDEEAPGRQLLEALDRPINERILPLGERRIPVLCEIGKYSLSAHADRGEIIGLVHIMSPKQVYLVHGEGEALVKLGRFMQSEIRGHVYLPENGETHEIYIGKARKQGQKYQIASMERTGSSSVVDMEALWQHLLRENGSMYAFSPEELLQIYGIMDEVEADHRVLFDTAVQSLYFEQDYRRPFLLRPVSQERATELKSSNGRMEVNQMLALAESSFPPSTGLYKKGARIENGIALLYFKFPIIARDKYKESFEKFNQETGWQIALNQDCNLEAAEETLQALIPSGASLAGKMSYYREEGFFKIRLKGEVDRESLRQCFQEKTGLNIVFDSPEHSNAPLPVIAKIDQIEQNQALQCITETFAELSVELYKKSLKQDDKGPFIEVSFISPEIGHTFREHLDVLEQKLRWCIKINPTANQNEILKVTRRTLERKGLVLKKNPSFLGPERKVRVVLMDPWNMEWFDEAAAEIQMQTGYMLIYT